jgi:hypothetical protein
MMFGFERLFSLLAAGLLTNGRTFCKKPRKITLILEKQLPSETFYRPKQNFGKKAQIAADRPFFPPTLAFPKDCRRARSPLSGVGRVANDF